MGVHRRRGMILAAGLGTRLLPITEARPKPLVEVAGHPLIFHVLSHMRRAQVEKIVINTHYLAQQILDAVGHNFEGIPIHYLHEAEIRGTGGAVKHARELLQGDGGADVLLLNGDILIDLDVETLFAEHLRTSALATLMLKTVPHPEKFGAVGTDGENRIRSLVHYVPYQGPKLLQRMFCGAHLLSPDAFHEFPKQQIFSIVDAFYAPLIVSDRKIMGLEQRGYYCDAGTPADLFRANMDLLSGRIQLDHADFFSRFDTQRVVFDDEGRRQYEKSVWFGENVKVSNDATIIPPAIIDDGVEISAGVQVGPHAVIGKNAIVLSRSTVAQSLVLSGTEVLADEVCEKIIAAPNCRLNLGDAE